MLNQWKAEKAPLEAINKLKEQLSKQITISSSEREGDYAKASEIKYGKLVKLQQELIEEQEKLKNLKYSLYKEEVDEHDIATVLSRWTEIPVEKLETAKQKNCSIWRSYFKNELLDKMKQLEKCHVL